MQRWPLEKISKLRQTLYIDYQCIKRIIGIVIVKIVTKNLKILTCLLEL